MTKEITTHETVSPFFEEIQPGTPGDDDSRSFSVNIKETFEKILPL